MKTYILRWNPAISSYTREAHREGLKILEEGGIPGGMNWSIREWQDVDYGDMFILLEVGTDNDGVAMIGRFGSGPYAGDSWRKDGTQLYYADLDILNIFDRTDDCKILPAFQLEQEFPEITWHGGHSGVLLDTLVGDRLFCRIADELMRRGIWNEHTAEEFFDIPTITVDVKDGDGKHMLEVRKSHEVLELKANTTVPFPDKVKEGYRWSERSIVGNIDASKMDLMVQLFLISHDKDDMYFFIEYPDDSTWFIDDLDAEGALDLWCDIRNILLTDGETGFGFSTTDNRDVVYLSKYNRFELCMYPKSFARSIADILKIKRDNELRLVEETFTEGHAGTVRKGSYEGKTADDLLEMLKDYGIYPAPID